MDLGLEYSRKRARILFNVSNSSLEDSTVVSGNTSAIQQFNAELNKQRREVNIELAILSKNINLAILIVFGLYSYTWYLIGIQFLPEPNWGLEIKCNLETLKGAQWSFYEKRNLTSPKFGHVYQPGCVYIDYDYLSVVNLSYEEAANTLEKEYKNPRILKCVNHTINVDIPKEVSHIREFNLFCIKRSFQFTKVYVHFGVAAFGFPCGLLGDIYGRRPVNNVLVVLFCISAFMIPFSTNFEFFAIANFILGGTLYGINMLLGLIFCETYRNKYRVLGLLLAFAWFYVGCLHPEPIFNVIEVWRLRKLILAISLLVFVFGIIIVPESPRLLSIKRQFKTAWDWLHELGSTTPSNAPNYATPIIDLKYQLKIFSKPYLLNRLYATVFLNTVTSFFYNLFKNTDRRILKPNPELLLEMTFLQVFLLIITGMIMLFYPRKMMISIYYILLSLAILTNTLTESYLIADVSVLSGKAFSGIIYFLTIIYLIEALPTSHRASSMGLYLMLNHLTQGLIEMFIDDYLMSKHNTDFFTAFYCGVCMICAVISLVIPDTSEDIPDRKEDLFLALSCDDYNSLDISTSL